MEQDLLKVVAAAHADFRVFLDGFIIEHLEAFAVRLR